MKGFQKLVALACAGVLVFGLAACGSGGGGGGGNLTRITFGASGEEEEYKALNDLVKLYNETQGKEDGVKVNINYTPTDSYRQAIMTNSTGSNAFDMFYADDRFFKDFVLQGLVANLDELQETTGITLDTSALYQSGISRYRYDKETNTSNPDDPLYGVVRGLAPTIIYYNKTAFEKQGITCVSVPEEEITDAYVQAFNAEHGSVFEVEHLKRGFVRQSVVDQCGGNYANNAYSWARPESGEVMVFNNRIPMSWDEVEDLGKIMTKSYNSSSTTTYGYYTWWWFYYGFGVGGDCIEDITGNGDWVFTLKDDVPNFIVKDDLEGTVTVGQNTYAAGELISYRDRVKELDAETQQRLLKYSSDLDGSYLTDQVLQLETAGTLLRLPSERDAFVRFVKLAQKKTEDDQYGKGLEISPTPNTVTVLGDEGRFTDGSNAMIVLMSNSLLSIQKTIANAKGDKNFEWNVAPLPQYKVYNDDGTVAVHGIQGGASDSSALCVNAHVSEARQKAAMYFIKYLCTKEAQDFAAATGFTLPSRPDSVDLYLDSNPNLNLQIIAEAGLYETPGDWWYMPDRTWIENNWARDLNGSVRNGKMSIDEFFNRFEPTQTALNAYKH